MFVDIFQIGACHGKDDVYKTLKESSETKKTVVLIEPIPNNVKVLEELYAKSNFKHTVAILETAVSIHNGTCEMFYSNELLYDLNASAIRKHTENFVNRDTVEKIVVPCKTVDQIADDLGIKTIDTLVIDTEGFDFYILMSFNFSRFKPKKLVFEHMHMDGFLLTGPKYNFCLQYLEKVHGYKVTEKTNENTTMVC
jgi:FkbM family methyltransferase